MPSWPATCSASSWTSLAPGPDRTGLVAPHLGSLLGCLAGHVATGGDHLVLQALHLATRLVCPGPEALAWVPPGQVAALWHSLWFPR